MLVDAVPLLLAGGGRGGGTHLIYVRWQLWTSLLHVMECQPVLFWLLCFHLWAAAGGSNALRSPQDVAAKSLLQATEAHHLQPTTIYRLYVDHEAQYIAAAVGHDWPASLLKLYKTSGPAALWASLRRAH